MGGLDKPEEATEPAAAKPITMEELEKSISLLRRMVMNQKRMVLYTDTIQGQWTYRDDLWAISTSEVEAFISLARRAQVTGLVSKND
jgi:hypothetical protein